MNWLENRSFYRDQEELAAIYDLAQYYIVDTILERVREHVLKCFRDLVCRLDPAFVLYRFTNEPTLCIRALELIAHQRNKIPEFNRAISTITIERF